MQRNVLQTRRWMLGAALLLASACGDETLMGPAPMVPELDGGLNITVADLTVELTYEGQKLSTMGLGNCYYGLYAFAIPSGASRVDNPPSQFGCPTADPFATMHGLPPGDYSLELRSNTWSKAPFASPVTLTLAAGPNATTLDLSTGSGLLTGPVTINGEPPTQDYRLCFDDPLIGPAGQDYGTGTFCSYMPTGGLKLLVPSGTTSAYIASIWSSTRVATLTFPAVKAGETTTMPALDVKVADLTVQLTYNGKPVDDLSLSGCYYGITAFAIPSGQTLADSPPVQGGCVNNAPFTTLRGLKPGDYSVELRPGYWSGSRLAPPVALTLPAGSTTTTIDLASGTGVIAGAVTLNGEPAGNDHQVCYEFDQVGPRGENYGRSQFCSYVGSEGFRILAPAGVTSVFIGSISGNTKVATLSFRPVQAGQTTTVAAVDVSTADLKVKLVYNGQPLDQIGLAGCYNGLYAFAIPTGKTVADNPPSQWGCFTSFEFPYLKGLPPGDYSLELRPSHWSKAPFATPVALTLAAGANATTLDLATNSGLLTGTLTVNGQPATSDYRVCYEYQQVGPQGEDWGVTTFCGYVIDGAFKLLAPAGSLSATVMSSSNQKVASIASAIAAGQTTTLGGIAVGTPGATLVGSPVEVHPVAGGVTDYTATITFDAVTAEGITSLVKSAQGSAPPTGLVLGSSPVYFDLSTTAQVSGAIKVCLDYTGTTFMRTGALRLLHRNATTQSWTSLPSVVDVSTRTICATTTSLSTFVIAEPENRAPSIASATGSAMGILEAGSVTVSEGTTVTLAASATDADQDVLAYTWAFSDGAPAQLGATIERTFGDNGAPVTATVTVKDGFGGSVTKTVEVAVTNVAPTATFGSTAASLIEGHDFILSLTGARDVAGDLSTLTYAFDCGTGSGYEAYGTAVSNTCRASVVGERTVKGRVRDKDGGVTEYTETVVVTSANRAPTAAPGSNATGGIYQGSEGAQIEFNGSASSDADEDDIAYEWNFDGSTEADGSLKVQATSEQPGFAYLDDGVFTATLTVRDGKGGNDTKTVQVTVSNTNPSANFVASPPSLLSGGSFSLHLGNATDPGALDRAAGLTYAFHCGDGPAPESFDFGAASSASCATTGSRSGSTRTAVGVVKDKDGGMRQYSIPVNVAGNLPPMLNVPTSYSADEGAAITLGWSASDAEGQALAYTWDFGDGVAGSGATLPSAHTYSDDPAGSTSYTITVTADDGLGALTRTATATVSNIAPNVGAISGIATEPAAVGTPAASMRITAPFTDVGTVDTHTGSIACGNGTTVAATIAAGTASGTCTYSAAGVFRPSVTVTDDDGGSSTRTSESYAVVYDASAGFVTGGGWIRYDAASCTICGGQAGRGDFGFVSKYQKGASRPTGETRFEFHAGTLNFASYEYEWLVVANNRAQYRGSGRINGKGDYHFILTAVDGTPDTFRIQIWDKSSADGDYVFDNRTGTALDKVNGNGSITIHSK